MCSIEPDQFMSPGFRFFMPLVQEVLASRVKSSCSKRFICPTVLLLTFYLFRTSPFPSLWITLILGQKSSLSNCYIMIDGFKIAVSCISVCWLSRVRAHQIRSLWRLQLFSEPVFHPSNPYNTILYVLKSISVDIDFIFPKRQ